MLFMSCVCRAFASVHCCPEGKWLLALVCDVSGPDVVLDCIDS